MPISVFIDPDDITLIHSVFAAHWTWDEYDRGNAKIIELASSVEYPVDLLTDLTQVVSVPKGNALARLLHFRKYRPMNLRYIIICGVVPEILALSHMANRLNRSPQKPTQYVHTLAEAHDLLNTYRCRV